MSGWSGSPHIVRDRDWGGNGRVQVAGWCSWRWWYSHVLNMTEMLSMKCRKTNKYQECLIRTLEECLFQMLIGFIDWVGAGTRNKSFSRWWHRSILYSCLAWCTCSAGQFVGTLSSLQNHPCSTGASSGWRIHWIQWVGSLIQTLEVWFVR